MSIYDEPIHYPVRDGTPRPDDPLQSGWIVSIKAYLDTVLADLVAGDLLWYPVQGAPRVRIAPDILVACGRPKGRRSAYLQWREDDIAPQVVFDILTPDNTSREMVARGASYARHGVEEFYTYNPTHSVLLGWRARSGQMAPINNMHGFTSPRLGVRFDTSGDELRLFGPDGQHFHTFPEMLAERDAATAERDALRDQRDALRDQRDALRDQRNALRAQRDAIQAEREAMKARIEALQAERDAVKTQAEESQAAGGASS